MLDLLTKICRALALMLALMCLPGAVHAAPVVSGVRTGVHVHLTRFVLDLSESIEFRLFTLPDPYRVVVDLPTLDWRAVGGLPAPVGLIRNFRHGKFTDEVTRVVLDLTGPAAVHRAFVLPARGNNPYRFVIDLSTSADRAFRETSRLTVPKPAMPLPISKPGPRPADKFVIALDPGHGGIDPGTTGTTGAIEKRITLAFANEMRDHLEASGRYQVVLTRNRDIFVRLRDRIAIARRAGAHVFLSLHADSIASRSFRGASVYTLSEDASDAEAAALASKENKADIVAGVDFEGHSEDIATILIDLAQRETMNASVDVAKLLLPELARVGPILRKGHRFAGFAVLKAPDVPSVLIELGYLSNREDEAVLKSPAKRQTLVKALGRGLDEYFRDGSR